ncbi:MAG: T9SS type A sorting domain-containing protein, partial [Bacteroidales bacterium]|nr:T9SS type A sorting domain-containing protein [Bacteroidales bacterium]
DPSQFEYSGTVTARVFLNGEATGSEDDLLMAYVDDECRGVMYGMYFDPASAYAYQMLIYSNLAEGEQVTFRYYHAATGRTYDCAETLEFRSDMIVADAHQAFAVNLDNAVGIDGSPVQEGISLNVYPNPFRDKLRIDITVQEATQLELSVYDLTGKLMMVLGEQALVPGTFSMEWNAGGLSGGTYILKAVMDTAQIIKRVTLTD